MQASEAPWTPEYLYGRLTALRWTNETIFVGALRRLANKGNMMFGDGHRRVQFQAQRQSVFEWRFSERFGKVKGLYRGL